VAILLLAPACSGDGESSEEPPARSDPGTSLSDKGPPSNGHPTDEGEGDDPGADAGTDPASDPGTADEGATDPGPADEGVEPLPPPPGAGALKLTASGSAGKLAGTYAFHDGSAELSFEAALNAERQVHEAIFTTASGETLCAVELIGGEQAKLTVGEVEMDGRGPLKVDQLNALTGLGRSEAGAALALAPLEIACTLSAGEDEEPDARVAALLLPWQMLIKYSPDYARISDLVPQASCTLLAPAAPPEARTVPSEIKSFAAPTVLQLASEDPIPHVLGYWPFDGTGAALKTTEIAQEWQCQADCEGACGQGCGHQACTPAFEWTCLQDEQGGHDGRRAGSIHWLCGTHPGCREHDSCYSRCNEDHECGSWAGAQCRRACDAVCMKDYCDDAFRCECVAWARGGTPFDRYLDAHSVIEGSAEVDHAQCPPAPEE